MNLIANYDQEIAAGKLENNAAQREILTSLSLLAEELTTTEHRMFKLLSKKKAKGCYIYGSVGAGKTFLMDLFFNHVAIKEKKRFHFHLFMQQVDAQLRHLQGTANPLQKIASDWAASIKLLCLDEFMVEDVAYAMILAELLLELFERGVVLVATSNTPPDDLYKSGPQRARFLPAIAAIKSHCDVLHLQLNKDYRLGHAAKLETYVCPLGKTADDILNKQFDLLAPVYEKQNTIKIQNRDIPFVKCAEQAKIIWFEFDIICNLPRSQLDYLQIANQFQTVFISNIPALTEQNTIYVILLMHLVDVMYDQRIKLILSAAVPLEQLYVAGELIVPFKRTISRLEEMQSQIY